ncbi:hypothetical protein BKA64DRAFT_413081 [Cadophora sp. MPI-SDFR-AT-0126]|nr:hypothetical protein BKA64DRAFT_413081 [Leotiomycetes sp. MPI-SDFR-AT-0126]
MASSADIVSSMRSLDLGTSPDLSNPKTATTKAKTKTTNSQRKQKPHPVKTKQINVPKGPLGCQSSKSQSPKSQARPIAGTGYTPLGPLPKIIDKAEMGKTYQLQSRAELGAVPASPKKIRSSPQKRTTKSNQALTAAQASLSSQPISISVLPKSQAAPSLHELTEKVPQQIFKYVVQASGGSQSSEVIVGVYSDLERANECAKGYVGRWGVGKSEIVDIQSSFGCTARARRRSWQGGMSEIRVGGAWVKVLPKEFIASEEGDRELYVAVDMSGGLFVIGIFADKDPEWEACKKYQDQLAYCSEIEGKEQWFDGQGMFHSKGKIGGMGHHWFVAEYALDGQV